ncbi:LemA family protein [Macrococcus armenti]|uniref:LemA family protein n=1 Tax=Macrococcus armenti TaxID=2875764 RepID=A0ABY3ZSY4_9STAP|nr:LemA family protein [Macrococcus armenti]UBH07968.1 LemA family protein [Macrococcus armenti]UBH10200.1 LemA family protein [Macrococcus armenti]UBH12540.1 LemA family protein [Macrococcus armenti]UBH14688.1 LemA family protein [Macrococcus armenti]UBH17047.1 LemA family protein [Macrococcus armenti]
MKKLLVPIIGLVILLMIVGSMLIGPYNKLVDLDADVDKYQANIDTQLQRRIDLIPNLVETVKGYAKHEEKVFKDVSDARAKLAGAGTMEEKAEANAQVNSALGRLIAIQENYPELKADSQFTGLRDELAGTENRIAVARNDYNAIVTEYNKVVKRFPGSIVAGLFGFEKKEFFKAESAAKDAPKIDFNSDKDSE